MNELDRINDLLARATSYISVDKDFQDLVNELEFLKSTMNVLPVNKTLDIIDKKLIMWNRKYRLRELQKDK